MCAVDLPVFHVKAGAGATIFSLFIPVPCRYPGSDGQPGVPEARHRELPVRSPVGCQPVG